MTDLVASITELILYLEPLRDSTFRAHVNNFVDSSTRFHFTTAYKYDCHSSMTGFFSVKKSDVQPIISALNTIIHSNGALLQQAAPTVDTIPLLIRKTVEIQGQSIDQYPVHLLLPLSAPEPYHHVVREFAAKYPTVRPKAINHISLAYWDEPSATPEQLVEWHRLVLEDHLMDKMFEVARETFKHDTSPVEWDIALYERTVKGLDVGSRHKFVERGRWPAIRSQAHQ